MRKSKKECKYDKFMRFLSKNNINSDNWTPLISGIYINESVLKLVLKFKTDYVEIEDFDFFVYSTTFNSIMVSHYEFENYWYDIILNILKDIETIREKYSKIGNKKYIESVIRQKKLDFIENL